MMGRHLCNLRGQNAGKLNLQNGRSGAAEAEAEAEGKTDCRPPKVGRELVAGLREAERRARETEIHLITEPASSPGQWRPS